MKIIYLGIAALLGSASFGQTVDTASDFQTLVNTKSGHSDTLGDKNQTTTTTYSDKNLAIRSCAVSLDSVIATVIWNKDRKIEERNKDVNKKLDSTHAVSFKLSDVDPAAIKVNYYERDKDDHYHQKGFKLKLTGDLQYYELIYATKGGQKLHTFSFRAKDDADRAASLLATLVQGCQQSVP